MKDVRAAIRELWAKNAHYLFSDLGDELTGEKVQQYMQSVLATITPRPPYHDPIYLCIAWYKMEVADKESILNELFPTDSTFKSVDYPKPPN